MYHRLVNNHGLAMSPVHHDQPGYLFTLVLLDTYGAVLIITSIAASSLSGCWAWPSAKHKGFLAMVDTFPIPE